MLNEIAMGIQLSVTEFFYSMILAVCF